MSAVEWYARFRLSTGALVAIVPAGNTDPLPEDTASIPLPGYDPALHTWDAASRWYVMRVERDTLSPQEFIDRLGDACVKAVLAAARGEGPVAEELAALVLRLQVVPVVRVTDPRTIAGVDALIQLGFLDPARRDAVLALRET